MDGCLNLTEYQRILRRIIDVVYALDGAGPFLMEQAYLAIHHQYMNWPNIDDKEANRQSLVKVIIISFILTIRSSLWIHNFNNVIAI